MCAKKFILWERLKRKLLLILHEKKGAMRTSLRTLKFRPTLSLPTCIHRKVSDERPRRALEIGDFPLHILESRRKERLAELKQECDELKNQLSEHSLQAALLREEELENESNTSQQIQILTGHHSKSMHELRRFPPGSCSDSGSSTTATSSFSEESMRKRREERLQTIRRELEEFAIRYSIGEFAEKLDQLDSNLDSNKLSLRKPESFVELKIASARGQQQVDDNASLQETDAVDAAIFLRIQRQREQELQRARMELKHLAFRLKHKIDEENAGSIS